MVMLGELFTKNQNSLKSMKTILAHLYYNSFFDNGQWISKQWDNWWGKGDKNQLINFWVACDYNGTNKKENNGAIYD